MTGTISTESVLIIGESNWIQMKTFIWSISFVWANQTDRINQMNPTDASRARAANPRMPQKLHEECGLAIA
jgi:hypothetical protein